MLPKIEKFKIIDPKERTSVLVDLLMKLAEKTNQIIDAINQLEVGEKKCFCGEPWTEKVVHRQDAPCYYPPKPTPEPSTMSCEDCFKAGREKGFREGVEKCLEKFKQKYNYGMDLKLDDIFDAIKSLLKE